MKNQSEVGVAVHEFLDLARNFTFQVQVRNSTTSGGKLFFFNLYIQFLLYGGIALFGALNNIANMMVFHRMGLKDSMSVNLMALSLHDFLICFISVTGIAYFIWNEISPDDVIDAQTIEHVSIGWLREMIFLCSGWITTALSVERCVCVVFPFHVKQIFTKTRSVVVILIIDVFHIAVFMPVFLSHWLVLTKVEVPTDNGTAVLKDRMVVEYAHNRPQIQLVQDILFFVSPFPSQILVLISVFWMMIGLEASSKIRNSRTSSDTGDEKKQSQLSPREIRLVKVALIIAIILTLCIIPRFFAVYAKAIFPEVTFGNDYGNLYMFLWNTAALASIVNSSANIFAFMTINTSYRETFMQIFCSKKDVG